MSEQVIYLLLPHADSIALDTGSAEVEQVSVSSLDELLHGDIARTSGVALIDTSTQDAGTTALEEWLSSPVDTIVIVESTAMGIRWLDAGASDFVTSDRSPEEISARVRRQLSRQADRAAEREERAEFLSKLAHSFKNPLNGIFGFTELLLTSDVDPEVAEDLAQIRKNADSLLEICRRIDESADAIRLPESFQTQ
ncbi:MAG: histidine kinase dimerization/phospho-acceptor domain-containing protein [Planctomycetota bacterium]